uniref:Thioredoxin domain-containing protein n=1 Tax=Salix viminalis TaxID=40686 RepID=A0A6N2KHH0_SALVM
MYFAFHKPLSPCRQQNILLSPFDYSANQDQGFPSTSILIHNLLVLILKKKGNWDIISICLGLKVWKLDMGLCLAKSNNDADDDEPHLEFAGGNVHLITTKERWDQKLSEARRDDKIVLANFSATWCGPCRQIAPFYNELSESYPSLMFLLIDVDELSDFSASWAIKATPTFFFLRDGQQLDKLVGANKPELQKKITAIADSLPPSDE